MPAVEGEDVGGDDGCAGGFEGSRLGLTLSAGGAGDDDDLAGQVHQTPPSVVEV
jgi:hypothetical protein